MESMCSNNPETQFVKSFFHNTRVPIIFYNKLEESNSIICQIQLDNIYNTIALIKNSYKTDKINYYLKNHLQKCIQWCVKNRVEYNVHVQLGGEHNERNIFKNAAQRGGGGGNVEHSFALSEFEEKEDLKYPPGLGFK